MATTPEPKSARSSRGHREWAVLRGVTFGDYVRLRDDPKNAHLRMTYYDGTLEIMSPSPKHERPTRRLGMLVSLVAMVRGIDFEDLGSTTYRRGRLEEQTGHGKEPDDGFYFANEPAIRDKDEIDLDVDPPPDLWIEVDHRSSSRGRLPLYAALGIPEVWRYFVRRQDVEFLGLRADGSGYDRIERSRSLPMLTPALVTEALKQYKALGGTKRQWMEWVQQWAAALPDP